MMPTIRIDDDVWQALKARAEPFVDTPNDVLRRLLLTDVNTGTMPPSPEAPVLALNEPQQQSEMGRAALAPKRTGPKAKLDRTPEAAFRKPILHALIEMGGQGRVANVLERVRQRLELELKPDDFKKVGSGEIRWENTAKWVRKHLVDERLLDMNAPHGVWKITQLGRDYLKEKPKS